MDAITARTTTGSTFDGGQDDRRDMMNKTNEQRDEQRDGDDMAKDANRARALDALMEQPTLTAAASAAGISRRQLFNYLHNDSEFAEAYQQRRRQMAIEQAEQLDGQRQRVLDAITAIMDDQTQGAAVRLKAAAALLNAIDSAQKKVDGIATSNRTDAESRDMFGGLARMLGG